MHIEPNALVSKHAFIFYSYELQLDTYAYLHDGSQSMSKFSLMKINYATNVNTLQRDK